MNIDYRFIDISEWEAAILLTYRVFMKYDAPSFSEKGIEKFKLFIYDENLKKNFEKGLFQVVGAFDGAKMVGVIALRDYNHISLLFVDEAYQKIGIGGFLVKQLLIYCYRKLNQNRITVNSSPYAEDFYHHLGFKNIGGQINDEGILFTPMILELGE